MNWIKKHIYFEILGLIIFLGIILRAKGYLLNPSFWLDESALGWNILHKSYLELFSKLRFLQLAPPMFLVCSKFLVAITGSYNHAFRCDLALRTIPFLCGIGSIWLFYLVSKQIINSKWARLAGVSLFALNPVLINYSFEFKPYSTDVFCSLLAIYLFLKIDFKTFDLKRIFKYSIILAILPWFSFASSFVIFGGFVMLSFDKSNPRFFTSLLMPPVVSAFTYLHTFIVKAYIENSTGMLDYWQNQLVNKSFSNVGKLNTENLHYFFMNVQNLSVDFITILAFVGLILFFKDKKYNYLCLSIMTLSITIVASSLKYYPFSGRMILFLLPLLLLYVPKVIDTKKLVIGWILVSFVIIPHIIFAYNFINLKNVNKGDFARNMFIEMAQNISPDEQIILNGASNTDYYYYNSFFKLKNHEIYLKPKTETPTEINKMLSTLKSGNYWLYMPYDYQNKRVNIDNIVNWANKNAKIEYQAHSTQSTLMEITIP